MADDMTTETLATAETPAGAPAAKKTRATRKPKIAAEAITPDVATAAPETPVKKTRAKRGSKSAVVKTGKSATEPKKAPVRAPRAKAAAEPVSALDDIADLLKLEEENKQLRKALSEKLRAENADLRKRLGQA